MTLPSSGALVLGTQSGGNSINSEFGYGNDMASYQGVYYGKGGQEYRFPLPGNSIDMNGFYSTSAISGGSASYGSSQYVTIPVYNSITITAHGGNGGQAGYFGYNYCNGQPNTQNWSGGGAGGATSFGGYVSAGGGSGGTTNSGQGGSPGATNSSSYTNPIQGGSGPTSGSTVYVSIGGGGGGGGGGSNYGTSVYPCFGYTGNASGGNSGNSGYVTISWS
jgi:hypothetical protein